VHSTEKNSRALALIFTQKPSALLLSISSSSIKSFFPLLLFEVLVRSYYRSWHSALSLPDLLIFFHLPRRFFPTFLLLASSGTFLWDSYSLSRRLSLIGAFLSERRRRLSSRICIAWH
jgi:hypothetical protein